MIAAAALLAFLLRFDFSVPPAYIPALIGRDGLGAGEARSVSRRSASTGGGPDMSPSTISCGW